MPSMNEYFAENMTGKTVKFDVQPYARGEGTLFKVTPRVVKTTMHDPNNGRMRVEYECFDLEIIVSKGTEVRSLSAGVPNGHYPLDGNKYSISGVGFRQLHDAVKKGETIVIARCG